MAIGALVIGGILWLLMRLFRRKPAAPAPRNVYSNQPQTPTQAPDFLGTQTANSNRPTGPAGNMNRGPAPQQAPDFLGNNSSNRGDVEE
jgi:hypothetical protein